MKFKVKSSMLKVKNQRIHIYNILFLIILSFGLSTFIFQLSTDCEASYLDIGLGPRAQGMGNAFTGLADDALAMYYNPAGVGQLFEKEVGFSYAALYSGLDYPTGKSNLGDMFIGYVHPLPDKIGGTIGGMWLNRQASNIYSENSFIVSYGRRIREGIYVGANFKILQLAYSPTLWTYDENLGIGNEWDEGGTSDPVFDKGTSAVGVGLDLGVLFDINERLRVGFCVKDFNQPNVSLKDPNPVPMSIKVGAKYEMGEYRMLCDLTTRNYDYNLNLGVEWWMTEMPIGIRGGFGFGSRRYSQISMGASYLLLPLSGPFMYQFDYAFMCSLSGIEGTGGTHRFGMTMRIK